MNPSRRSVIRLGAATVSALFAAPVLAACGTDASDRYKDDGGDAGYVAGDGVYVEVAEADRKDPITLKGTGYDGEDFDSSALLGAPLVINVWYAACAPCRKEAPRLVEVYDAYKPKGVNFVGVNTHDAAGPAHAFEDNFSIPYPSLPDPDSKLMYAMRGDVSPNAVPSTLVLDAEGRTAARISGLLDASTLSAMLDTVLAETA